MNTTSLENQNISISILDNFFSFSVFQETYWEMQVLSFHKPPTL